MSGTDFGLFGIIGGKVITTRFLASRSFIIIALFLGVSALSLPASARPGEAQTVERAEDRLNDVVNIDLRTDVRLFTVMAALNLVGFDAEAEGHEFSEVRKQVRAELEQRALPEDLMARLNSEYKGHSVRGARAIQTAYTSLALVLTGPPEFDIQEDAPLLPPDVREVMGFQEVLADFYELAEIGSLWEKYREDYAEELRAYTPVLREVIRETLEYFRIPARIVLDRQIVLMADLLTTHDVVNARNLERVYYIVVGPAEDPASNALQLQHEYLHFLVDPLVEKHGGRLEQSEALMDLVHEQPYLPIDFEGQFLLTIGESLIEAVLHKLHPSSNPDEERVRLFRRGLIFYPYFQRMLVDFERNRTATFPAYVQDLFAEIDQGVIEEDAREIALLEEELRERAEAQEEARRAARQAQERKLQISEALNRAGKLISEREFASAREVLQGLLESDPENGYAQFYLAQIASQEGDFELAFERYSELSARADLPPWIRGWSALRQGRQLAHQGSFEEARKIFLEVLALEGDLQGAREAARESLGHLPQDRP